MAELIVRRMQPDDVPEAARIEKEIFSTPWTERGFMDSLAGEYTIYLVAEVNGQIAGYCGLLRSFEEADITNMAVAVPYQRQGIGRALLTALMEEGRSQGIERFTLEVRKSNAGAISLYESLGFATEGVRKNFYTLPTEDALIMWTPPVEHRSAEK